MKICPNCQNELNDEFSFCDSCGSKLDVSYFTINKIEEVKQKEIPFKNAILTFILIFISYMYIFPYACVFGYFILNAISPSSFPNPNNLIPESLTLLNMILNELAGVLTLALMVFFIVKNKQVKEVLGLTKKTKKESIKNTFLQGIITFGLLYVAITIVSVISLIFPQVTEDSANQEIVSSFIDSYPIFGFFSVVIMAPIVEELVFRFFLCKPLEKKKKWLGVIVSALLFGGIHLIASIQGGTFLEDLPSLLVYVSMGFALSFRYAQTDNVSSNIIAHAIYNCISFISILSM